MEPLVLTSQKQLGAAVEERVEAAIQRVLPEMIRRALLPPYLTKQKLKALTGWSDRQIEYKKAQREIPYVKRGRLVLFPTEEIIAYLEAGRVPARD